MTDKADSQHKIATGERKKKKAYVKPAFEFERVFETMALSCGKIHANIWACKAVRKNS
jgi:hypothetical protein